MDGLSKRLLLTQDNTNIDWMQTDICGNLPLNSFTPTTGFLVTSYLANSGTAAPISIGPYPANQ
jgi:hypothetical protein